MAVEALARPTVASPVQHRFAWILAAAAVMFVVLQGGLTLLSPRVDLTLGAWLVTATMFIVLFMVERFVFRRGPLKALRSLGYGRPRRSALAAAATIAIAMTAFLPVYAAVTGTPISLRPDWLWILTGAIVLNGLAEETLFRGFVFGHLRQYGLGFRRAGFVSLLVFGAVHLFLFTSNPPAVALLATLLAVAAAFPFAFLFERSGATIWAGVIVHVAAHVFRLVEVPEAQMLTVASVWILFQFSAVFAVFAFRNNLLRPGDQPTR